MSGVIDHKAIRYIWLKNTSKRPAGEPVALFACVIAKFRRARETQARHLMVTDTQLLNFGAQDYSEPNRAMLIANLTGVVCAEQSCEVLFQFKGEYGTYAFHVVESACLLVVQSSTRSSHLHHSALDDWEFAALNFLVFLRRHSNRRL
jgi:hypothetical protein